MARTPSIPGVTINRSSIEYNVELHGNVIGWLYWDDQHPNTWTADHLCSFPGQKSFTGPRARRNAIDWLLKQEAKAEAA